MIHHRNGLGIKERKVSHEILCGSLSGHRNLCKWQRKKNQEGSPVSYLQKWKTCHHTGQGDKSNQTVGRKSLLQH